jgi:hypothetical protein
MRIYDRRGFFIAFPRLKKFPTPFNITSPATWRYNCIAWAVGDGKRKWWPHHLAYWPEGCPEEVTISAFEVAFSTLGYERCNDGRREKGYEKIVLYATGGESTHAARQLKNGRWTSKLGDNVDIEHKVKDLEGPCYGKVAMYFSRHRQNV